MTMLPDSPGCLLFIYFKSDSINLNNGARSIAVRWPTAEYPRDLLIVDLLGELWEVPKLDQYQGEVDADE